MTEANPAAALRGWAGARGGAPLITFYGDGGSRIELSGASAWNGVHKAVNLFSHELLLDPGDVVWLDLPCHWQVPILALGAWAAGLTVAIGEQRPPGAAATLGSGTGEAAGTALAVSLHPWGMPLGDRTPHGWEDYAALARIQPDQAALRWTPPELAWLRLPDGGEVAGSRLAERADALARRWGAAPAQPLLTRLPPATEAGLLACTVVPARAGASVILATSGETAMILRQEGNPVEACAV